MSFARVRPCIGFLLMAVIGSAAFALPAASQAPISTANTASSATTTRPSNAEPPASRASSNTDSSSPSSPPSCPKRVSMASRVLAGSVAAFTNTVNTSIAPRLNMREDGSLGMSVSDPALPGVRPLDWVYRILRYPLGLARASLFHQRFLTDLRRDVSVFERFLGGARITVEADRGRLEAIPRTGPLLVVLNHPLTGLDVLAVAQEIARIRGEDDVSVMLTDTLANIPALQGRGLFVDLNDPTNPANRSATREGMRRLQRGGTVIICPGATVSTRGPDGISRDPAWMAGVTMLAQATPDVTIVPVFVHGEASNTFHLARRWQVFAGSMLLLYEIARQEGSTIRLTVGRPITLEQRPRILTRAEADQESRPQGMTRLEFANYLRAIVYALAGNRWNTRQVNGPRPATPRTPGRDSNEWAPIIPPVSPDTLEREIGWLGPENLLGDRNGFRTYVVQGSMLPNVLRELGRLREETFRPHGEGTGNALDLDEFDEYYMHLFVWDTNARRIVGAYRMGLGDQIMRARGVDGFFLSRNYDLRRLFDRVGNDVIELGRTFVVADYQRSTSGLPLLWRGIGEFMVRNPRYIGFTGEVSISNRFQETSRQLLVEYLRRHHSQPDFAGLVTARNPATFHTPLLPPDIELLTRDADIRSLATIIESVERNGATVPVLFRQYLMWGGTFNAFNYDSSFGSTDGMNFTDMRRANPDTLRRYLGREGAVSYLRHHGVEQSSRRD